MGMRKVFAEVFCVRHGKPEAKDSSMTTVKVGLQGLHKRSGCPVCKREEREAERARAKGQA